MDGKIPTNWDDYGVSERSNSIRTTMEQLNQANDFDAMRTPDNLVMGMDRTIPVAPDDERQ
jgi:hypothetical protein